MTEIELSDFCLDKLDKNLSRSTQIERLNKIIADAEELKTQLLKKSLAELKTSG